MDLVSLEIPSTLCTQAKQCTKVRFDKFLSGENLNFVNFIICGNINVQIDSTGSNLIPNCF